MATLKWCHPLSHLQVIITEEPKGGEVIQSEMPNMWVNQITAHIQHGDQPIHRRDTLIGQGTLCPGVPEDILHHLRCLYVVYTHVS